MEEVFWLSTSRMTVLAVVQEGLVIETAPITHKFVGQPIGNLVGWMRKQPGFSMAQWKKHQGLKKQGSLPGKPG